MQDGKWVSIELGGMDERIVPDENTASLITNMWRDPDGTWRTMPGIVSVGGFSGSLPILSLFWFEPAQNIRYLVFERTVDDATSEIQFIDTDLAHVNIAVNRRRTSSATSSSTQFLQIGRWLYIFSPLDGPIRWNGYTTRSVGFNTPAPQVRAIGPNQGFSTIDYSNGGSKDETLQRGIGPYPTADASWKVGYALTVINDLGNESPRSALTWVSGKNTAAGAGAGRKLVKLQIPELPPDARAFRLWRTTNMFGAAATEGVPVYLHSEWTVANGCEIVDHVTDDELGLPLNEDEVGTIPQGSRAAAVWENRLWLGGHPDDPSRARYSHAGLLEQFPSENFVPIGSAATGAIVAYLPIPRGLLVFKTGGIYIIKRTGDTFHAETISEEDGCPAPRAITYVPDRGAYFVDRTGPKLLIGSASDDQPTVVVPLNGGCRDLWKRVGPNLQRAAALYDPDRREVWWTLPEGGNTQPSLGVVLHLDTNTYSQRPDWYIACFTRYKGRTWLGSWESTAPGIWLLGDAGLSFDRVNRVEAGYTINYLVAPERVFSSRLEVQMVAYGEVQCDLDAKADRAQDFTDQALNRNLVHPLHDRDLWGVGVWGAGHKWSAYEPAWIAFDMVDWVGHELQFRVRGNDLTLARARAKIGPAASQLQRPVR